MTKRRKNTVGVARAEKKLVKSLFDSLKKTTNSQKVLFSSEVDCFQGVADLVLAYPNGYRLISKLTKKALSPFSFSTAKVLAALSGRKFTDRERLANKTGLTPGTVAKQLGVLHRVGIVENHQSGRVSIRRRVKHPFKAMTAFEVKVKDWTSGIYQARNYRSFAHEVFLALPLAKATSLSKRADIFRRLKVGLVGIGKYGELVWIINSPRRKPISSPRSYLVALQMMRENCGRSTRSALHA
jgi:hypothetical protein